MLKPIIAAIAAAFMITPALAAPSLNDFAVFSETDAAIGNGKYGEPPQYNGDIGYGMGFFAGAGADYGQSINVTGADQAALVNQAKSLSAFWANNPSIPNENRTGTSFDQVIQTDAAGAVVITLSAADLAALRFPTQTLTFNAPNATSLILNVAGADVSLFQDFIFAPGTSIAPENILFNFFEATELKGSNFDVPGTILAPYAAIKLSNGDVSGIIVGKDYDASAVNVLGKDFFGFNGAVVPEPSTWALLILGFGVIGFAMRRRNAAVRPAFA